MPIQWSVIIKSSTITIKTVCGGLHQLVVIRYKIFEMLILGCFRIFLLFKFFQIYEGKTHNVIQRYNITDMRDNHLTNLVCCINRFSEILTRLKRSA